MLHLFPKQEDPLLCCEILSYPEFYLDSSKDYKEFCDYISINIVTASNINTAVSFIFTCDASTKCISLSVHFAMTTHNVKLFTFINSDTTIPALLKQQETITIDKFNRAYFVDLMKTHKIPTLQERAFEKEF